MTSAACRANTLVVQKVGQAASWKVCQRGGRARWRAIDRRCASALPGNHGAPWPSSFANGHAAVVQLRTPLPAYPFPTSPRLWSGEEVTTMKALLGLGLWWNQGFWPGFWWILPVLVIGVCLFMLWARTRCGWRGCMTGWRNLQASNSALDILNKRYARGEIGKSEYEEKKKALTQMTA